MPTHRDFKQGDRVEHRGEFMGMGTISSIMDGKMVVIFDRRSESDGKNWRGIYDDKWLAQYPGMLVRRAPGSS